MPDEKPSGLSPTANVLLTVLGLLAGGGGMAGSLVASSDADKVAEIQQAMAKEQMAQFLSWNKAMSDELKAYKADQAKIECSLRERISKLEAKQEALHHERGP